METRLVTLAIHTYRYAVELRRRLKENGIEAALHNVDFGDSKEVFSGVRVRIAVSDLPKALRIVESEAERESASNVFKLTGTGSNLLVPVDFSPRSDKAVETGFDLAERLGLSPVLLHAMVSPYFQGDLPMDDVISDMENIDEAIMDRAIDREAVRLMENLKQRIHRRIAAGSLPDVKFTTEIREGVPEEVILQYARQTPPAFIVMATRGISRRSEELIGSVTAEVVDSARVPIFVVPENYAMPPVSDIQRVAFFCNLDQQDILAMDIFQRMFNYPNPQIFLVPVNERASGGNIGARINTLETYFRNNYPASRFTSVPVELKNLRPEFEDMVRRDDVQLIVVPNKKRNIFTRLFNPSVAHRLLFEKDIPMIVLPA